ncbi:M56 family metallopeptidase [Dokdonella soli]|uniref:Peptidase M56 domain-containing protein n=1 Tax=Dokdonella soli TaxID=529810 RepID=A0ABP3U2D1_9GAMM
MRSDVVATWLLTLALHAGVLLTMAWIIDRGALRTHLAWRELLWRVALFGSVLTASAQCLFDVPVSARLLLPGVAGTAPAAPAPALARAIDTRNQDAASDVEDDAPAFLVSENPAPVSQVVSAQDARSNTAAPRDWRSFWHLAVIVAWLAGLLLALSRIATRWLQLSRVLVRAKPIEDAGIVTDARALAIQACMAPPRLAALDDLASPFAVRSQRIVLPCWALDLLDREQLRAMLAHETAHLARRDPIWKLATAIWCAALWFVPVAALARRRLGEIAELACDTWAARHLGDGRSLAECLAECAERRIDGFDAELAPAMAHRDSPFLQRIDHLIDGAPMHTDFSRTRAGIAAFAALALAAAILPGVGLLPARAQIPPPAPPAPPAAPSPPKSEGKHVHISADIDAFGTRHRYSTVEINDGGRGYSAKIRGEVAFNEDEDGIAKLSDDGSASFSETRGGTTRRVDYANRSGKLEERYFVDDREQAIDAAARTWIAGLIPVVIRETALNADVRVKRLLAKGGAGAVLDEIDRIESGYARSVYVQQLAASAKLTPAEVTRTIGLIGGIDSDYERRNALAALATAAPFDAMQQKMVIAQAGEISSDYERAELLVGILPKLASTPDVHEAWLRAASGIGSDYEHRRVLTALLDAGSVDDAALAHIIEGAKSIGSDYERRELLVSAVRRAGDADRIAPAYATATADIGSDYERREALLALMRAPGFGAVSARAVLDAAKSIGSDYECREVLIALARVMPADADLIARYRDVARRLSESERGAAERALDRFAS